MALSRYWFDDFFDEPFFYNRGSNRNQQKISSGTGGELAKLNFDFSPSVDVRETENAIIIHADLPGVSKDNMNIDFNNGQLRISGKRDETQEEKGTKWHRVERHRGTFSRSIALPKGVQPKDIKASQRDGVLEVTIDKAALKKTESDVHRINID